MQTTAGHCASAFGAVRDVLEENLSTGEELGAGLVVDIDGERVIDLWGGFRDVERRVPWTEDTLTNVWSTTKTVTSLAALVLVERGVLDVNAPVATYWPEFALNGKDHVLVRHLLSHTSGVSGWEQPIVLQDIYDRAESTDRLARQAPWWAPGTASGYHGQNMGHLVGELVRRTTGVPLREFVAAELAGPLGADFQIGVRQADLGRVADIVPPPPHPYDVTALDPAGPMYKTFTGPPLDASAANSPEWRNADLGALNGHGTARSIARLLSAITLGGSVDGTRLLSPATIDLVFQEQAAGIDLVIGEPLRWGIGYALPQRETFPYIPDGRVCFWGGWGGSIVVMDLDRRMTACYVMNKMGPGVLGSPRTESYLRAIYGAVR
ncbi:EstA family serine hydrolase [Kitasatospora mediocidica]|uniref:EstA family serine hydrolase n=1 Tax=Kitasatospora mediocidica TaxID=58352 RepID=UPI00056CE59D|nr:EstA family serine hydrolase [Kitasatospora mediocidica]